MRLPLTNHKILGKLDAYPELQKDVFEKVLQEEMDNQNARNELSEPLKMKYLKLKCKLEPDLVSHILEKFNFPLDQSLEICTQAKNHFAIAFLKFRLGIKEEAINEYLRVSQ